MSLTDRLIARLTDEIRLRGMLISAAAGGSVQFTVQLDASGSVKQIKTSVQVASGVIPK